MPDASRQHSCRLTGSPIHALRSKGFTLIELLVVVAIIGITISLYMTVNFSFNEPSDVIEQEANRLRSLMQFTHEQAVVRGEEYGLRLNEARYRFMKLDYLTGKWEDISNDKLLRSRKLPDNMSFELALEDVDVVLDEEDLVEEEPEVEIKPQIFLLSSGELTPMFDIRLRIAGFDQEFELHGDATGQYELRDLNNE